MSKGDRRRALCVLICDEQALFRAGLGRLIQALADRVEVREAADPAQALRLLSTRPAPALVLTDLPSDGGQALRRLVRAAGDTPVVAVTANDRPAQVHRATAAGARGLVPKSSPADVLLAALRLVLAGGVYLPPTLLAEPARAPARGLAETAAFYSGPGALTPRQREIVDLLAEGKSNGDIARTLGLSTGTVKIHMSRIFRALGVRSRTQALVAAGRMKPPADRRASA
jgi:DNA-binding NarL/FixJ family response regulator